jgi:hypothetical protein
VTAPTVITYGTLPGTPMVIGVGPRLPAATTTTMPAFHAAMTAWLSGSSQYAEVGGALRERFMTRML